MPVDLSKHSTLRPYGTLGRGQYSYTPNVDGTVPEYVLNWRRHQYGSKVPATSGDYMSGNDLECLRQYFVKAPILKRMREAHGLYRRNR